MTRFAELQGLKQELHKTKSALAERKLVDRAKGMLMKHHGLAEDDAYKALRKMAMDRNWNMGEAARNVIAMTELLTQR